MYNKFKSENIKPIILASGFSRRFRGNKLLVKINKKPMYRYIVDILIELRQESIVASSLLNPLIVSQYNEILEKCNNLGLDIAYNEQAIKGLSSSIQVGIEKSQDIDGASLIGAYAFFLADQIYLPKIKIEEFIYTYLTSEKGLAAMSLGGSPRNPAIFNKKYRDKLLMLEGDLGAKDIICSNIDDTLLYIVKENYLRDIDTRE